MYHLYDAKLPEPPIAAANPTYKDQPVDSVRFPLHSHFPEDGSAIQTTDISGETAVTGSPQVIENASHSLLGDTAIFGFVPYWSNASVDEVAGPGVETDTLLLEWSSLNLKSGLLVDPPGWNSQTLKNRLAGYPEHLGIYPVVDMDFTPGTEATNGQEAQNSISQVAESISAIAKRHALDGVCVNIAGASVQDLEASTEFIAALRGELEQDNRQTCLIATIDDVLPEHPEIHELADKIVLRAFREPGPFSGPVPLAPQDWFERSIPVWLTQIPSEKLIITLGNFGLDWVSGAPNPAYVRYFEVTDALARYNGNFLLDPRSLNSTATFSDDTGRRHHVWVLDAISVYNQLSQTPLDKIGGIGIWPLSGGDSGIWNLLRTAPATGELPPNSLEQIIATDQVLYFGDGPLIEVEKPARNGRRIISTEPESGLIVGAEIRQLPLPLTIVRSGEMPENSVVLTFDDGPHGEFTPKILDTLGEYGVPGVFFVVGAQVQDHPDLARRIVGEGHELGVHTFTHPNIAEVSDFRLTLELHATQELIESVTGVSTNLFRAPYGLDENPETSEEASVLSLLTREGYVVVSIEVDSGDWTRPVPQQIFENVVTQIEAGQGNVILLHDAGGDRIQTVRALPLLLDYFRDNGITVLPLSVVTKSPGNFPASGLADPDSQFGDVSFWLIRSFENVLTYIFFIVITAGILRSMVILALAFIKERGAHKAGEPTLPVTVLIPAFCEETVIAKSIRSVLASDYPIAEVIVIDDGSTDSTSKVVRENFGLVPLVRLVRQENAGKAEALNHGIRLTKTPVFVAIDADTIISGNAIGLLVRHFNDERVGAVAGNVKVGNRKNLLTKLQTIEYVTAQNLDRRAFEIVNGIMVVPGSVGAWRIGAVRRAGGYTTQTLVEDADLTVSTIRSGYSVVYEPDAHAFTEAPETIGQWMRQRLRWHFGMLQVAWKHKSAFLDGRAVGLVSIPDLVLFGAIFSLFAPIADLILISNLMALVREFPFAMGNELGDSTAVMVALAYVAYLLSDLALAAVAFWLEPNEDKRLLPWVLTQRFFYRQIYWMVALRSIARVLTGQFTGWHKITRTASVDPTKTLGQSRAQRRTVVAKRPIKDAGIQKGGAA